MKTLWTYMGFDEALNRSSVAGNVGVGVELSLPGSGLRVTPELRYAFGITPTVESFQFLGPRSTVEEERRLNTYILSLGLSIPITEAR